MIKNLQADFLLLILDAKYIVDHRYCIGEKVISLILVTGQRLILP